MPEEEKEIWHAQARKALDEHKKRFPGYAFRPGKGNGPSTSASSSHAAKSPASTTTSTSPTSANGAGPPPTAKRRVREVEPKDEVRCAQIAALLVRGLKGKDLEMEMAEFDKRHVKEVRTRFEAPITEVAFRKKEGSKKEPSAEKKQRALRAQSSAPAGLESSFAMSSPTSELVLDMRLTPIDTSVAAYNPSSPLSQLETPIETPVSSVPPTPSFDFDSFGFAYPPPLPQFPTSPESCTGPTLDMSMFQASEFDPAAIVPAGFDYDFSAIESAFAQTCQSQDTLDMPPLVLPPSTPTPCQMACSGYDEYHNDFVNFGYPPSNVDYGAPMGMTNMGFGGINNPGMEYLTGGYSAPPPQGPYVC